MATQVEMLRENLARMEARLGKDAPFVTLLRQQLAGAELNQHNKNERFLISTGEPQAEQPKKG